MTEQTKFKPNNLSPKKIITLVLGFVFLIFIFYSVGAIVDTVNKGTYQIKQAAITGKMSAKMTPGIWLQLWGDIQVWSKAETFYFTADFDEGARRDQSIEVRFNDGSLCNISGTLRILLPISEQSAIDLITVHGYRDYIDLEEKMIKPAVRNALRLTANLMTARESYSEKRQDYVFWAWDQIQNGLYKTTEETRKVTDLISGEQVTQTFKIILTDSTGNPIYERNPLRDTGITLMNFEVKTFVYSDKVKDQIATQQEALMNVATAKAKAAEAEQEALTKEAEGKANVMIAKYEKEEEKVRAVVKAQMDKEVAEINANRELEVAKLQRQAAGEQKKKEILLGEGESARKRMVMAADGALKQKLDAYVKVQEVIWKNISQYKGKWVPEIMLGGNGSSGNMNGAQNFIDLLLVKTARDLSLDMSVPKGKK